MSRALFTSGNPLSADSYSRSSVRGWEAEKREEENEAKSDYNTWTHKLTKIFKGAIIGTDDNRRLP